MCLSLKCWWVLTDDVDVLVFEVSSIHMLTSLNQRPRFSRTAVLSGIFA